MTGPHVPADDRLRVAMLRALVSFGVDLAQETTDALLPVVRAYGDLRAAEELRAAAKDIPRFSPAVIAKWLRDRAAVLTAREEAGR